MIEFSINEVATALKILAETSLPRKIQIYRYTGAPKNESEDENYSCSPIFDSFLQFGRITINFRNETFIR